jgi:uncharacterized protein YdhG (YjbR/CyaY superfamily)
MAKNEFRYDDYDGYVIRVLIAQIKHLNPERYDDLIWRLPGAFKKKVFRYCWQAVDDKVPGIDPCPVDIDAFIEDDDGE